MRLDVRQLRDADVVLVEGALDLATRPRLGALLASRIAASQTHLIVDLNRVTLLDAGTVSLLLKAAAQIGRRGGALRVIAARGIALEVLEIVGADKRLCSSQEPAEVIAEFGAIEHDGGDAVGSGGEAARRWAGSRDVTTGCLLGAMAHAKAGSPEHTELRAQVIEDNMSFAIRLVRRFRDRGEPMEDLNQVALVGLVNAVDGFDPGRGCEFVGYATPTIVGEVRRYFRDKGWRIKVPRRLQELRLRVNRERMELSQTMGASPTNADIAAHLGVEESAVAEAVEVSRLYHPVSLSAPACPDGEVAVADWFGADDPGIEAVDNRVSVAPLLAGLPDREKKILTMRFFANMTQSQIAAELGISQMHVSRLLAQTLEQLRSALAAA
jgi:RNA polymerase sigma-B factor